MSDSEDNEPQNKVAANVHTGVNEVDDDTPLDVDEEDEYDFQLEPEPIFNRLASQIYERYTAGAREALTNAVTSVLRAQRRGYLEEDEAQISFDLYHGGEAGADYLTIRDNGLGMSLEEIDNVVSVIGATTARDEGELAGQFGMGFLALFKLCGLNDSFVMHSNSRLTEREPFSGIWNAKRFTHDTNGELETPLAEDEYGVRFDFELADSIDAQSFAEDLRSMARYVRVPVTFTEYEPDASVKWETTLGGTSFTDDIDDDALYIEYEDDYVHAVASKEATPSETLLLDVPVKRGQRIRFDTLPWRFPNVTVRLKNEKGIVVDGPNEGKMVASSREYEAMEEEGISEGLIRETELDDEDIPMPRPIGSRDKLEQRSAFWQWLADRLDEAYQQKLQHTVSSLQSVDDIYELDNQSYQLFSNRLPEPDVDDDSAASLDDYYNPTSYDDRLQDTFGTTFGSLTEPLNLLATPVPTVVPGVSDASSASNHTERTLLQTAREAYGPSNNGDVYMAVTVNNDRAAVVWDDNRDNHILALPSSDWYDPLEEHFGFPYLKDVKQSSLDDFDVSAEVRERFLDDTDETTSYRDSDVTIHFGRRRKRSQTKNVTVPLRELLDATENCEGRYDINGYSPHTVIAFPRQGSYNLSERKGRISCSDIGAVSLTQPQWELAKEHSAVTRIDDYVETAKETAFTTSVGEQTLETYDENTPLLIHALPSETAKLFQTDEMMDELVQVFADDQWSSEAYGWGLDSDEVVYAPVAKPRFRQLWPVLNEYDVHVLANEVEYARDDPGNIVMGPLDSTLYVLGKCPSLRQTDTMRIVETGFERSRTLLTEEQDIVESVIADLQNE